MLRSTKEQKDSRPQNDHWDYNSDTINSVLLSPRGSLGKSWSTKASPVAQMIKNPPAMQETWVRSLGWDNPLEKGKATHSSILAWRIVHGVAESWTRLSDFHFLSLSRKVEIYILYIYFTAIFSASRKLPAQSRH